MNIIIINRPTLSKIETLL